jgi:phosphatidylserine/phosphatidylglycerophosphate/cardiolipin synthase-like enzyme/uncharacterized membrane protein YidH (DUF202 family)
VILIMALAGGIGGFLGGWTLPVVGKERGKYGLAKPTAISMGVVFGTLLFLAVVGISLLTRPDVTSAPAIDYVRIFLFVGAIFGLVYGLLQGVTTVGLRRTGSIVLASTLGFAMGGAGFGLGFWLYFGSVVPQTLGSGMHIYLLLGLFLFGFAGGVTLALAYHRLAKRQSREDEGAKPAKKRSVLYYVMVGVAVVAIIAILALVVKGLIDVITPRESNLLEYIPLNTIGTHWMPQALGARAEPPADSVDLSASHGRPLAVVWSMEAEPADIYLTTGSSSAEGGETSWTAPVNVSSSPNASSDPRVATGPDGRAHVVWREEADGMAGIMYSVCEGGSCTGPVNISDGDSACPATGGSTTTPPTYPLDIAVDPNGNVMVAWLEAEAGFQYALNPHPNAAESPEFGCIPPPAGLEPQHFVLDDEAAGSFWIVSDAGGKEAGSVWLNRYQDGDWDRTWLEIGQGHSPDLKVGTDGSLHAGWCSTDGVYYWHDGKVTKVADLSCLNSLQIAQDSTGRTHILWESDSVETVLGDTVNRHVLYESRQQDTGWSAPAIVASLQGHGDLAVENDGSRVLHMTWTDGSGQPQNLQYALQIQYECVEADLTGVEEELYQVAREGGYRPADDIIPFCGNRYEDMLFTPNPDPAFSDQAPTLNGGYDGHAQLIETAEHEVLFTTMAFDEAVSHDSPGAVLADSVFKLYQQVLANPEDYPRGMHVRLMLGNSPPIAELELDAQLWYFLKDLQEAGFEKMIDPDVGWKLEVANYAGAWPHSHVKTLVIDGKTVVASGFNHEYKPLPKEHPSGLGLGDTDTGIIITGPVAQHTRVVFEQLWDGAVQRHCDDLSMDNESWQLTCRDTPGVPAEIAEAMRFYPTEGDAVAFSMFRSHVYDESDQQILRAFGTAEKSIDVAQAMFSMPSICILNHFFDVCSYYQALPYMRALMRAAENGAHLRILLTPYPSQNIENVIAAEIFLQESKDRGLKDRVELRFFDTFLHSKSALIEGEFLIMGSQNLHYSAFERGEGLAEYNLGTSDPMATDQYRRMYEYYWDRSETQ